MDVMCRVTLRTTSAIPADYVQNQFCVTTGVSEDLEVDDIVTALKDFYDEVAGYVLATGIATTGHMVKFYALPGIEPNYPFAERTFDLASPSTGTVLPTEVCIAVSFQGSRAAGFPQARRRGRIFLPYVNSISNVSGRPGSTARTAIAAAASALAGDIGALPSHRWAVWSTVDQEAVVVEDGWVDDAFDTQRRRGLAVTSRTTWAMP